MIGPILIWEGINTCMYPDFGTVTEGVIVNIKSTVDSSAVKEPNPTGFAYDEAFNNNNRQKKKENGNSRLKHRRSRCLSQ